jgi:hypothetical protein
MSFQLISSVLTPAVPVGAGAAYDLATLADVKTDLNIPLGTAFSTTADVTFGNVLPFASTGGISKNQTVSGVNIAVGCTVQSVNPASITLSAAVLGDVPAGSLIIINDDATADTFLARQITLNSAAIAKYCNRQFPVETIQDLFDFPRNSYHWEIIQSLAHLNLSKQPVVQQTLVTNASAAAGAYVLTFAAASNVVGGQGAVQAAIPPGTLVEVVSTAGGVTSVALTQPLRAALASGTPVLFGPGVTVTEYDGTAVILTQNTDFLVDPVLGKLTRLEASTGLPISWRPRQTVVVYPAGFVTIPPDIDDACSRMVKKAWWARGRDPSIMETGTGQMGSTRYWVDSGNGGNLPPEIREILDQYRFVTVG